MARSSVGGPGFFLVASALAGVAEVWYAVAMSEVLATSTARSRFWYLPISLTVLAAGWGATILLTGSLTEAEHQAEEQRFLALTERLTTEVQRRFTVPLYGLRGAAGLYPASKSVERHEFRAWVAARDLPKEFPGVRGLGFIERVPRANLADFLAFERADGAPDFQVKTSGEAPDLFVIKYIEPLVNNQAAWGYDIGQEAHRREAASRAARTGLPALTRAVTLVQDHHKTPGFLLLVPVYRPGLTRDTEEQRWAALHGWTYTPIIVGELLKDLVDITEGQVDAELFDGQALTAEQCLLDLDRHLDGRQGTIGAEAYADRTFSRLTEVTVGGRTLYVKSSSTPTFHAMGQQRQAIVLIGGAGALISLLSALAVFQLGRSRAVALRLASAMTRDLAEAKRRAEDALRDSQTFYQTIQRHAIVSATDRTGTILDVNDHFCRISGFPREELLGGNHRMINSGTHPPEFWREMYQTVMAGKAWRGEVCNRAKDGSLYWVDSIIAPFLNSEGVIERIISIRTDVTARVRAQHEMAEMNHHLEEQTALATSMAAQAEMANAAKSGFLANMSHEIRTPMNGVLGMTELLIGMGLNPEQEDAARTVYRSAESLLTILNDILDFSKIEAGRLDLESIPFDLHQLVYDVSELFRGRLVDGDVELLVHIAPGAPRRLLGDPGRVRQILTNLVGNAVKFTKQGHILIDLQAADTQVCFQVIDTGVGIPEDRQEHLFQPFTQADASMARKFGGTGLGLAISRRLAEVMGGDITLESDIGVGTTFHVRLIIPRDEAPPLAVASPASLAGRRVLILGDRPVSRSILVEQLTGQGAEVRSAELHHPPLAEVQTEDVVVLDLQRLEIEATDLIARFRSGSLGPALVLVTATGQRGDGARLERAGFNGYLVKPAPVEVLAAVVATAIERHAVGAAALATRHQVAEAAQPAAPVAASHLRPGLRVLLAEDNRINQRVAKTMLERLGCVVSTAQDGCEAVATWQAGAFDVILMDCQMPEMDGFEATTAIRAAEATRGTRIPIIAMTANAADEDRERCRLAGMDDHLAKPARQAELLAALERWVSDGGAPAAG
jgi:PAS domain S-box-containing protein